MKKVLKLRGKKDFGVHLNLSSINPGPAMCDFEVYGMLKASFLMTGLK